MSVGARAGVIAVEAKVCNMLYKRIADQSCKSLEVSGLLKRCDWGRGRYYCSFVEDTIVL